MRVVARRREGYTHEVEIDGGHTIVIDEPAEPRRQRPRPAPDPRRRRRLAACTAITCEMYAARKGWELGAVEVEVDVEYEGRGPRRFEVTLQLPAGARRRAARAACCVIAGKCPVHRALTGEAAITDRPSAWRAA